MRRVGTNSSEEEEMQQTNTDPDNNTLNQRNLPLKKRMVVKVAEVEKLNKAGEGMAMVGVKVKILPGVIRHTSFPHNNLAFYYHYSSI